MKTIKYNWGWVTMILISLLLMVQSVTAQMTIKIVSVPQYFTPLLDTIFIAGTFNTWIPSDTNFIMDKDADGNYTIELSGADGDSIYFKFTHGDWDRVETELTGLFLADRFEIFENGITKEFTVANWQDQIGTHTIAGNVIQLDYNFFMSQLERNRRIWIYLPPDYLTTLNYYPVVYMHDGQNVFDYATSFAGEWDVDGSMENIIGAGHIPSIVVAVANGEIDRIDEYSPWVNGAYGGGDGDLYADFIVNTLKPYIDANYRTLADRENTVVGGSSLGGLISYYMALQYDDIFGKAIVFSPSFWFADSVNIMTENFEKEFFTKIYITAGQFESDDMVTDINEVVNALQINGFTDEEIISVIRPAGAHSEWFWKGEYDDAYLWLFEELIPLELNFNIIEKPFYFDTENSSFYIYSDNFTHYIIYDLQGRMVESNLIESEIIHLNNYQSGIYFISVSDGKNNYTSKILIL